jgi:4-amino-4-deoxy-L-arabinose transferase-like glycosyltransferase
MELESLPKNTKTIDKTAIGILLGAVALYLLQQAIGLDLRWVDDETWYLMAAKSMVEEGRFRIPVFQGSDREFWAVPPVLTLLQAGSWSVHSLTVVQARALCVAFGVGVVVLTYAFGSRLLGRQVGVVAALICSMDNLIYLAGRTVRPEILVAFFTLLALWLLWKGLEEGKRWPIVVAGCAVAAGVSSHPNGAVAAACGVALVLSRDRLKGLANRGLYLFAGACFLAFLPTLFWIVWHDAQSGFQGLKGLGSLHSAGGATLAERVLHSASGEFFERFVPFAVFPYRLHIALLSAAAVLVGLLRRRREVRFLAVCVLLYLLYFLLVVKANKSPRYLTLVMPFLSILWAEWVVGLYHRFQSVVDPRPSRAARLGWGVATVAVFFLVGFSQLTGNAAYLWKNRHADYPEVCRRLDALIPPSSTIYGGMAFWMNLRHHTYVPYMRMPWERAVQEYRPNVVILDDWVMMNGYETGEWRSLREQLQDFVAQHGTLLGEVDNSFYGNLKVYRVSYGDDRARLSLSAP